jgi:hypothetical protein
MSRYAMDEAMAEVMREEGMTYREIGIELAKWEGRSICYGSYAVANAIRRFKKKCNETSS